MKDEYDLSNARRGAPFLRPAGEVEVRVGIQKDLLDWMSQTLEATGGGRVEDIIDVAIRSYLIRNSKPFQDDLRRMIREEVRALTA